MTPSGNSLWFSSVSLKDEDKEWSIQTTNTEQQNIHSINNFLV